MEKTVNQSMLQRLKKLPDRSQKWLRGRLVPHSNVTNALPNHVFPQQADWDPSLFTNTHTAINRVSRQGIMFIELLFKTLNTTLQKIDCEQHCLYLWGKDIEYAKRYEGFDKMFFFEHGWLPRSSYQMSPQGCNFSGHFSKWNLKNAYSPALDDDQFKTVCQTMRTTMAGQNASSSIPEFFKQPFILFAFQLCNDYNLKLAGDPFSEFFNRNKLENHRYTQFCIDYITEHNPDMPVIFKQHPMDITDTKLLKVHRPQDRLITNEEQLSLSDIAKLPVCEGVITVNSNSAHEALVFDVPVKILGNFLTTNTEYASVFGSMQDDFVKKPLQNKNVRAYLHHVLSYQWYSSDFANPLIVAEMIEKNGLVCPRELREKYRYML